MLPLKVFVFLEQGNQTPRKQMTQVIQHFIRSLFQFLNSALRTSSRLLAETIQAHRLLSQDVTIYPEFSQYSSKDASAPRQQE